jgi:hypothetical protein
MNEGLTSIYIWNISEPNVENVKDISGRRFGRNNSAVWTEHATLNY